MNSKVVFNKKWNGFFIFNKNVFDYQVIRLIDCHQKQPDLKTMVRLFFKLTSSWCTLLINLKKHFAIYYLLENEALLGSNKKKYEIRLYFYRYAQLPEHIILCFAISYLDMIGFLKSLYIRLLLSLVLPSIIHSIETSLKKISIPVLVDE